MVLRMNRHRARMNFRASEGGQALIEFALILPILLAFLVGILELGQAWPSSQALTHAAREGARLSVVPTSTDQSVINRIHETLLHGSLDPEKAQIDLRRRSGTGTLDTVSVHYPFEFRLLAPVIRLTSSSHDEGAPGTITISSTFVMRNE